MPQKRMRVHLLTALGVLLSVVPAAVCTVLYFPVFRESGGGALLSGGAVLLLVLCALPLFRYLKERVKSPSVPTLWGLCFLLFFALSRISEQMVVISFVGWISNLAAAGAFRFAKRMKERPDDGI